jgi:predicted ATPase
LIRNWKITNFKSVADGVDLLEFGPITIFAGANSSGKSTIIHSILLLMQSMVQRNRSSLVLNGDLITLGTVSDLWHNGNISQDSELVYEICVDDPSNADRELWLQMSFLPEADTMTKLSKVAFHIRYLETDTDHSLSVFFDDEQPRVEFVSEAFAEMFYRTLEGEGYEEIGSLEGVPIALNGLFPRTATVGVKRRPNDLDWPAALSNPLDTRLSDEGLQMAFPEDYVPKLLEIAQRLNITALFHLDQHNDPVLDVSTLGEMRLRMASLSAQQLSDWRFESERLLESNTLVEGHVSWNLRWLTDFKLITEVYRNLFSRQIRYLSANRVAPSVVFSSENSSHWSEVGADGSGVAAALQKYGTRSVTWFDPIELRRRDTSLLEATTQWLQFFGMLEQVAAEDRGKLGTFLKVRSAGVDHDLDLTSVGFGVSQVLPIVVQGLLTPRNGVFIVEQPEVHLHPAVQSKIAIFFLSLSRNGVQCIVETHSENIVNQFRLLHVDKRPNLNDAIKIYFAERDLEYGTRVFGVEMDRHGNIRNWPSGFMDETTKQNAALLRAMLADEEEEG